ncbi:unnamed protein product [Sphagnum troendelagicum]|jgi:hypothetical protein|uniref:Uncharacterized protein n=2 Tax=Sphagnum TaxID=13804 RepID=A0ABP0V124_9BRYO
MLLSLEEAREKGKVSLSVSAVFVWKQIRNTSYRGGGVIVCFLQLGLCFLRVTAAGFGDSAQRREVAL